MYLFTRRARLAPGRSRESLAWATDMTSRVRQIIDLPVSLSTPVFSAGIGTLIWASFAEDLEHLEAAEDKLLADEGYMRAVDEGAQYVVGGVDDTLLQLVSGTPDMERPVTHVSVVNAVCATGALAKGMETGVAIAQKVEEITGESTLFGAASTGPFGGVAWLTGYESIGALEAAEGALMADAGWLSYIDDQVAGTYVDDATITQQTIYRIIG